MLSKLLTQPPSEAAKVEGKPGMRLNTIFGMAALAATCSASFGTVVWAADLGALYGPAESYAEPEQPLEFGTGWYLRGDGGFSEEDRPKLNLTTASFSRDATTSGYSLGLGAGYKFNSSFRFDITGDYLDPFKDTYHAVCGSLCDVTLRSRVWRWDGLANGYFDLGTWFGITPYVGAGVGFSGTHQDGSVQLEGGPSPFPTLDPATGTLTSKGPPSHTSYQFAWAAMAGFSYAFTPHMLLDVNYRYLNLGPTTIQLFPLTSVRKDLTSQQIRLGVRYMID